MKHSFALWALLAGVVGASAQVSTQLGNTPYPPDMVVERSITTGGPLNIGAAGGASGLLKLNGTTSGSVVISSDATGNLFTNVPTGKNQNFQFNGATYGFMNSTGLNLGAAGTSGQLVLFGATSGQNNLTVAATGGHLAFTSSSTPTANSCAGFALGAGSTDVAGRVTYTSATTCSITFGTAFTNNPFCVVSPGSAASTVEAAVSTSGLAVTFGTAQTAFQYNCLGT